MNPCNYPHHKIRFMNREQERKIKKLKNPQISTVPEVN